MHQDQRQAAETFIEKVIAPRRAIPHPDDAAVRALAEFARENAELARKQLAAGGIEAKPLDDLAAERSKARAKLVKDVHRRAVEASAAAANRLRDMAPVILPVEPMDTVIDQVTFIRSFAGQGAVLESNIGPSNNWARYRLESTSDLWNGTGRLSFFTLWQNQLSVPAIVMARANLVINAQLSCDGDWSGVAAWVGMSSVASAKVRLMTTVWGMDSSVSSIVQQQDVAEVGVDGGFFGGDSSTPIEFNQVLPATGVVVPADAYVLIEIEVLTDWSANGGASVTLDAESGSHRIDLPQLILTVTPAEPLPPSISLSASVSYTTTPAQITLTWSGASGATVDVYRDGALFTTTANDGLAIVTANPGTYAFHVCNSGSTVCSNDVTVVVN